MSGIQDVWFAAILGIVALMLFFAGLGVRQLRRWRREAARMFIIASGIVGFVVFAAGAWLIGHIEDEPTRDEQEALLERYRRFVENSEAPNRTTLIELTNRELKARGTNLYTRIKAMNAHYAEVARTRKTREERKEIDAEESGRLWLQETAEAGKEFDENYRTDARMVLLELRNRIPYAARKHIVGLPNINPADKRAGKVSMYDIFPAEFAVGFSDLLAREIEELVKLLPDE
jgi:hypothetical protein